MSSLRLLLNDLKKTLRCHSMTQNYHTRVLNKNTYQGSLISFKITNVSGTDD